MHQQQKHAGTDRHDHHQREIFDIGDHRRLPGHLGVERGNAGRVRQRSQRTGLVASFEGWAISGSVRLTLPAALSTGMAAHLAERPLTSKGIRQVPQIREPRGRSPYRLEQTNPRAKTAGNAGALRVVWERNYETFETPSCAVD